jgi:GNAT superfamily N-acetyltransferase
VADLTARLGPEALDAIAGLCARAIADSPTRVELEAALTDPDQPAVVRGDPAVGVVATVTAGEQGFVRLLAVDPGHRRRGVGRALLAAAEADLRDAGGTSVTVGADPPGYLWPGVDARELGMLCLLERARYSRAEANCNLEVDLAGIPPDPGGWVAAGPADVADLDAWSGAHWDHWGAEIRRAARAGTLVLAHDGDGIAAVCAYDVTRRGLVGPVAVRPDLLGRGRGVAPLLGALHRMRADGRARAEISWVGPLVPYARVGATMGRVFFVCRKALR